MSKSLIIVESPTKAKTIEKFLGKEYEVKASYGHVRDLPQSASDVPSALKKQKWASLGINVENNFEPLYIIPEEKKKRVKELENSVKEARELYLATDEDREGESISWHLLEVLRPKVPVKRLVFHEITKAAIQNALESPRDIDENLVRAQETRRIIDRLFGYMVSPVLWKKITPRLSAGRVQSVAIRLLVQRERERMRFKSASYWDLSGFFQKGTEGFEAEISQVDGKRVASGKDFEPTTGRLASGADLVHLGRETSAALKEELLNEHAYVEAVEEKPFTNRPYPPFTTSTLQQEASRKLGFGAKRTMQVAQTLYENGFITYMRTDSTNLSTEAITAARTLIQREYGQEYLPQEPRLYKTKVKNAQEAHEAIRPSGADFVHPAIVKDRLGAEAFRLYELIWKRMVACQMKDAVGTRVSVQIALGRATFRASGRTIQFPGFLRAYVEGSDDPEADLADREKILPPLKKGDELEVKNLDTLEHATQPPARYTEGSLIKELERLGIGRPSTWATIVDVVLSRTYAFKRGNALVPSFLAAAVTGLMERYFEKVIDYEFTAHLEEDLDAISRGEFDNLSYLRDFYAGERPGLDALVRRGEEIIDRKEVCGIPLGTAEDGRSIEVRIGKYGPFLTDGTVRASIPDGLAPDELTLESADKLLKDAQQGPMALGSHPLSGKPIYLKSGRYGPYIQEGDLVEGEEKPKMASLLPGMVLEEVDLETALKILSLPRSLGLDAESGEEVVVSNGRFGPYVKRGKDTRSLPLDLSLFDITMEQALELLSQPKKGRGRQAAEAKPLKEMGKHPVTELLLTVKSGRYGPYVSDGTVNASLPSGTNLEEFTLDHAVSLIDQRKAKLEAEGPKKKKSTRAKKSEASEEKRSKAKKKAADEADDVAPKKAAGKKAQAKKATAKKAGAKKAAAKKATPKKAAAKKAGAKKGAAKKRDDEE